MKVWNARSSTADAAGGALYQVCSKLKKRGIEGKIACVFHEILLDEIGHKDAGHARASESLSRRRNHFVERQKLSAKPPASGCVCATSNSASP